MFKAKPTSSYLIQFGFYGFVLFLAAGILISFQYIFAILFISIILALLLEPLVNYFETHGINRILIILGIYIIFAGIIALSISMLVPLLVNEIKILATNLPEYGEQIHTQVAKLQAVIKHHFPAIILPDYYSYLRSKMFVYLQTLISSVPNVVSSFFSLLSIGMIIPFVTFFLLADGHLISKTMLQVVPNRYFEMCVLLIHKVVESLKLYIRGQLIDSCSIMVTTTIGYAIIGLPYFFVIGILSGLANFIPYFGPIISLCIALFVLMITPGAFSVLALLAVGIVFIIIQIIDGSFIYPNVVGRTIHLHPLVVILGITAGGSMAGIVGMIIAIPLISICKVTLEVMYEYLKSYSII